jgi:hypothetical protein
VRGDTGSSSGEKDGGSNGNARILLTECLHLASFDTAPRTDQGVGRRNAISEKEINGTSKQGVPH